MTRSTDDSMDSYHNYPEYENREEPEFSCPACGIERPDADDYCPECRADAADYWRERWDRAN